MSAQKLTQEIRAAKIQQGLPASVAQREAEVIVAAKKQKTKLGLFIVGVGAICAVLAFLLGLSAFWVIGLFGGACLWGATVWDSELITSSLKSGTEAVANGISAILKAIRGQP